MLKPKCNLLKVRGGPHRRRATEPAEVEIDVERLLFDLLGDGRLEGLEVFHLGATASDRQQACSRLEFAHLALAYLLADLIDSRLDVHLAAAAHLHRLEFLGGEPMTQHFETFPSNTTYPVSFRGERLHANQLRRESIEIATLLREPLEPLLSFVLQRNVRIMVERDRVNGITITGLEFVVRRLAVPDCTR